MMDARPWPARTYRQIVTMLAAEGIEGTSRATVWEGCQCETGGGHIEGDAPPDRDVTVRSRT